MQRPFVLAQAPLSLAHTALLLIVTASLVSSSAGAQATGQRASPTDGELDSLVSRALAVNPAIHAAEARAVAAARRVAPAGARPDPMLMLGIQNLPVAKPGFSDFMTMKMIGISQTFPFPGKLAFQTRVAESEVAGARAAIESARLDVTATVEKAYYELSFADRALEIVLRNQTVLLNLVSVAQVRYTSGTGSQADVLRARTEIATLGQGASTLVEQRRSTLAQLNAALDRQSDAPITSTAMPARTVRAAVADSSSQVRFASSVLGSRAADSPLLTVDALQALAAKNSPVVHEHLADIAIKRDRIALAEKAHLPDVSVSLSYGQRQGFTDMLNATVSLPLPVQRQRRQGAEVAAAVADLTTAEAQHHIMLNALDADIAKQVSDIERARTALALFKQAILPQAQATLGSTTASYQVGRLDFTAVMDAQASVFDAEIAYFRSLTDFAKGVAELERTVGAGVLR
ncbi:MAG: TolC family protein [Gemmatimonadota bacterium]